MRGAEPSGPSTRTGPRPKSADRRSRVVIGITLFAGLLFFGFFLALVAPNDERSTDPDEPFGYRFEEDDDERVGRPHLVTATVWSNRDAAQVYVTLAYREGEDGPFRDIAMQRIRDGEVFAAEIPSLGEGERAFYYLRVLDNTGATMNIPEHAPGAPLPHVRWEGHVSLPILALHITLMIGALFFLLHAVHFSLLVLVGGFEGASRSGVVGKIHRAMRWGWLSLFVGGIPLGIYVSGTALAWENAWGGWPLGTDITDTKTELVILYWGVVLALRGDLWQILRIRARTSDRGLAWLVLSGALLTAVVYAIPHSYFFQ